MTQEEINQMTGAATMNKPQLTKRTAIRVNGKKGGLVFTYLAEPKDEVDGYRQEIIDESINVVFLKVRRRLMQGSQNDGIVKYTNEHDSLDDEVTLFIKEGQKQVTERANQLREQYPELKTEQVVYVRYKGEVCKLSVKGLSLRGTETTTSFYDYLSKNENWYTFQTKVTPVQGEEYYLLNFERGDDLNEDQLKEVIENIKEVHENCVKVDEANKKPSVPAPRPKPVTTTPAAHPDMPEYPEEDLSNDPSEVPF